jgi:hypothetical protein
MPPIILKIFTSLLYSANNEYIPFSSPKHLNHPAARLGQQGHIIIASSHCLYAYITCSIQYTRNSHWLSSTQPSLASASAHESFQSGSLSLGCRQCVGIVAVREEFAMFPPFLGHRRVGRPSETARTQSSYVYSK